jgi:hypothetical protein
MMMISITIFVRFHLSLVTAYMDYCRNRFVLCKKHCIALVFNEIDSCEGNAPMYVLSSFSEFQVLSPHSSFIVAST